MAGIARGVGLARPRGGDRHVPLGALAGRCRGADLGSLNARRRRAGVGTDWFPSACAVSSLEPEPSKRCNRQEGCVGARMKKQGSQWRQARRCAVAVAGSFLVLAVGPGASGAGPCRPFHPGQARARPNRQAARARRRLPPAGRHRRGRPVATSTPARPSVETCSTEACRAYGSR